MKVETRTIHEPTGRSRTSETMSPDMQVMAPIIGDTITIFFMSWRNWRADEAGLKRRAKMRRPPASFRDRVTTRPMRKIMK